MKIHLSHFFILDGHRMEKYWITHVVFPLPLTNIPQWSLNPSEAIKNNSSYSSK